ncbi:1,4-alpha-glucan branching enzyme GlgB 2, partial [Clarias magur]
KSSAKQSLQSNTMENSSETKWRLGFPTQIKGWEEALYNLTYAEEYLELILLCRDTVTAEPHECLLLPLEQQIYSDEM